MVLLAGILIMLAQSGMAQKIKYPRTRKCDSVDVYYGVKVADPYRWLEDDHSEETTDWVQRQNEVTFGYLDKITYRKQLKERLTALWNFERSRTPFTEGPWLLYFRNDGLQNQSVLYIREGETGEERLLLDPNQMSADGTVALDNIYCSNDSKYMAYTVSASGSDWKSIYVMDLKSGKNLQDRIEWVKFSGVAWYKDGFYYSRYDATETENKLKGKNQYHKVYYHKLGTTQDKDVLVFDDQTKPLRNFSAQVTQDESLLLIYESEGTYGNALYCSVPGTEGLNFTRVFEGFDNDYRVIDNTGGKLLILTDRNAKRKQLVLVDPAMPAPEHWKVIIPEKEDVLQGVTQAGGMLIARYMKDAYTRAAMYDYEGVLIREIELPGIGTVGGFSGEKDENTAYYSFTSFTQPATVYRYDIENNKRSVWFSPELKFDPAQFEVKQIFYASKDGTKVPMFIVHKKGLNLNGNNPCMLYGYGGFNISLTPSFSVSRIPFLEQGGVYAVANIRGGGEYGEAWHKAGTKLQKQNVFDDFIAAAEYLIAEKYTRPEKLAISGGSNGGLLVGACMTQRPELFRVALPAVGVMDMLRFHKFTIGWAWTGDYGSSEDSLQFHYLYGYSPLHNIRSGVNYPATLVTTADHDDRVVPAHSFKFIATLQEKHSGNNPMLIRIDTKAGHGAGKPLVKQIEEAADVWSFVFHNLGVPYKSAGNPKP